MALNYIWLTDKLKGEYKEAFDKVEIYAGLRNVDEDTKDDMLMELLDLFLTAQKEGKPVRKLIGSDLEIYEKWQKKGKEPMTPEEYMEQLRRENIRTQKGDYIVAAIILLIVIGIIVWTALTSTVIDTLIFIVVLAVAEIPAMALFRFSYRSTRAREQLIEECDRQGITILEYVREREENGYE